MEYPGYKLYEERKSAEMILSDGEYLYNYFLWKVGYREQHLMIFGRSLGSGPATYLSSKY
jgi:hypothetical protein